MFTGIIEAVGTAEALDADARGRRLRVRAPEICATLAQGGSIAVNGCCLTIVEHDAQTFAADLSLETLERTAFRGMKKGRRVNLERPLTAGKELGGHFVQGHVDGVGRVASLKPENAADGARSWTLSIRVPAELRRYVALKGSIAIDGISLTVAASDGDVASMAIIPFTYEHTNICDLAEGDAVNVECDVLAKYIERLLDEQRGASRGRLTIEELREQGF